MAEFPAFKSFSGIICLLENDGTITFWNGESTHFVTKIIPSTPLEIASASYRGKNEIPFLSCAFSRDNKFLVVSERLFPRIIVVPISKTNACLESFPDSLRPNSLRRLNPFPQK